MKQNSFYGCRPYPTTLRQILAQIYILSSLVLCVRAYYSNSFMNYVEKTVQKFFVAL